MTLAITYCRSSRGIDAPLVSVETNITHGMPCFQMVGLPETAVKESKERVRVALRNSQFRFPRERIIINLAPADLRKRGGRFDLAIAIGILAASGQIPKDDLHHFEFAGELGFTGSLRPIYAALPFAIKTHSAKRSLFISDTNKNDVSLVEGLRIYPANHLLQVCAHLLGQQRIPELQFPAHPPSCVAKIDWSEVRGQHHAKKAMELAAAGGHNLLMIGPPGTGKTMLSQCLPGILPPLAKSDALEVAAINSLCRSKIDPKTWLTPPYRTPHHSASHVALVGGGTPVHPGEISRAHQGILFLDELPEFSRAALEALREPLESGEINIARANFHECFPAKFQLVAAMNPCPCGYANSKRQECRCTPDQIARYQNKISGPLLDRIDLHVQVPPLPRGELTKTSQAGEDSTTVRKRVSKAHKKQIDRQMKLNRHLSGKDLRSICPLQKKDNILLEQSIDRLQLSTRSYQNILRVARTIADLANEEQVSTIHLSEALSYRSFDKGLRS